MQVEVEKEEDGKEEEMEEREVEERVEEVEERVGSISMDPGCPSVFKTEGGSPGSIFMGNP